MTIDLIKFAAVAGEISRHYYGRSDLEKYDLALALGENWFVDYRGGVSTRMGSAFCDFFMSDDKPIKLYDFKFSTDLANTNLIIMGHNYIRFVQDGSYVTEPLKVVTGVTQANPGVVTATAHGYSNGDWIKPTGIGGMVELIGQTYVVTNKAANTFELYDTFGNPVNTTGFHAYTSGGSVRRIYTLVSPYDSADLNTIRMHQIRDTIRITHKDYKTRNLVRLNVASWTLALESFSSTLASPTGLSASAWVSGSYGIGWTVTSVNAEGEESIPADMDFDINTNDYSATAGGMNMSWTPVAGAVYYNVYRTRITDNSVVNRGMELGFIGRAKGAHFVDPNITPDFARTPPVEVLPFADGAIKRVDVTAGGTGYDNTSVLSVTDVNPGAGGFKGYPIIGTGFGASSGPLVGVVIKSHGHDYTAPVFALTVGTGATMTAELGPDSGNNPAVASVFQQRQIYGATENEPLTTFGSRPGRLSNFGVSDIIFAGDAYEHELDSDSVAPIRHYVPVRGGLIIMTEAGIWLLSGTQGAAVTPTNAQADIQAYKGTTELPPLKIDTNLLYEEGAGGTVRLLEYNDIGKVYSGLEMSVLANHLFSTHNKIKSWCYADQPFKLVWARQENGQLLTFTMLKEQNVFAWMRHSTRGIYEDVINIQEGPRSSVYYITKRLINGRWTKFLERQAERNFAHVEEAWCVDCGLQLAINRPDEAIQVAAVSGTNVLVTSDSAVFTIADVGRVLRANGGKMNVITYVDNKNVRVNIIRELTEVLDQTDPLTPSPAESGDWSLDTPQTVISGLGHLEGEVISVLADGNVVSGLTVTDGAVTLPQAASRVIAGLGYRALLRTLPPTVPTAVIEDKRARIVGIAMRMLETRGLKSGAELAHLYDMKERTNELWGEPTRVFEGVRYTLLEPVWEEGPQTYIVQDDPLPATVLGFVVNLEVGDADD